MAIPLLLLACFFLGAHAELRHIKTTKDYEKLKTNSQYAIYFYNVVSENERERAFGRGVRDLLALVDGHLDSTLDMDLPLAYVDCKVNKIDGLCDNQDMRKDFFLLALYDNRRDTLLRLQPRDTKMDEKDLLDLILRFYAEGWKNFHAVTSAKDVRRAIEANPQKDWFVCYGDRDSKIGKTFCLELAATYRRRSAINIVQIDKRSVVQDLQKQMQVELEVPEQSTPFGLWFFDCLADEGVHCKTYQYLMDESIANANRFVHVVRYPPVMEMSQDGSIPDLQQLQPPQVSLLYYFYRGVKLRWDAAKTQAFDIGSKLRGTVIVVVADVDELKDSTLSKFGICSKTTDFPVWKLKLEMPENSQKSPELLPMNGCPVEFVKNKMRSIYHSGAHLHSVHTTTADATVDDDYIDPKLQDDEVELVLQSQRDKDCYFCPPDYKRVTVLTDKTYNAFIEKRKTAIVLFWLNVDTTSRAALAVTIEASTLLDVNYAPFGAVACHDWPDVCQKALVKTWPKMMVFSNGQRLREYKSVWEPKLVANSAMLYAAPALTQITSPKELDNFVESKTIKLINGTFLQTVTVGLFKNEKARQIRALNDAAKRLHGQYAFGVAAGAWVKNWMNDHMGPLELPVIVTHKNNDQLEKAVLMDEVEDATTESITRFVQVSSRPLIAPLTKVSFPSIINRKVPILILMASNPTETEFFGILRNVEECLMSKNYVCVTLDTDAEQNLTNHLLKAYGLHESHLPVVVYVNPQNGHVHFISSGSSQKSVKIWLEHIRSKMVKPNVILPEKTWSPRPLMYDYLELTQNIKSECPHQKMQKEQAWRKKANARPWGQPEEQDDMDDSAEAAKEKKPYMKNMEKEEGAMDQMRGMQEEDGWHEKHECPYKRMAEEARRKEEEEAMKKNAQDDGWQEKHECPYKKMAEEAKKKEEEEAMKKKGQDDGWQEKHECPYKKMAEQEAMAAKARHQIDDHEEVPEMEFRHQNIRKIPKEILEEEEQRAQKKAAHDDEARDEL